LFCDVACVKVKVVVSDAMKVRNIAVVGSIVVCCELKEEEEEEER
jgi:hypothetical protein